MERGVRAFREGIEDQGGGVIGLRRGVTKEGARTAYSFTAASRAPISRAAFMRPGSPKTACGGGGGENGGPDREVR